jgi:hypothetical protein
MQNVLLWKYTTVVPLKDTNHIDTNHTFLFLEPKLLSQHAKRKINFWFMTNRIHAEVPVPKALLYPFPLYYSGPHLTPETLSANFKVLIVSEYDSTSGFT